MRKAILCTVIAVAAFGLNYNPPENFDKAGDLVKGWGWATEANAFSQCESEGGGVMMCDPCDGNPYDNGCVPCIQDTYYQGTKLDFRCAGRYSRSELQLQWERMEQEFEFDVWIHNNLARTNGMFSDPNFSGRNENQQVPQDWKAAFGANLSGMIFELQAIKFGSLLSAEANEKISDLIRNIGNISSILTASDLTWKILNDELSAADPEVVAFLLGIPVDVVTTALLLKFGSITIIGGVVVIAGGAASYVVYSSISYWVSDRLKTQFPEQFGTIPTNELIEARDYDYETLCRSFPSIDDCADYNPYDPYSR